MRLLGAAAVSRQRGFALLIVLWSLVFISFLITRMTVSSHAETKIALNIRLHAERQAHVDGAIFEAAFHLRDQSSRHWIPDGSIHVLSWPGIVVQVTMLDEATKINPNSASVVLLRALFFAEGMDGGKADALAAAFADWRDPGDKAHADAEAAQYQAAGLSYMPPGEPFRSLDEIGLVLGMNPVLLARTMPHLTLYAKDGPIEATPDPMVSQALRVIHEAGAVTTNPGDYHSVDVVLIKAVAKGPGNVQTARSAVIGFDHQKQGERIRILDWSP